jgi:hypothetical protein
MQIRDGIATSAPVVLNSTTRVRPPGSVVTFRPILQGCNEVSPNASTATGLGLITVDTVANTLDYNVVFSGLISAESAAHIHGFEPRGTDAGVIFTLLPGTPKIGNVSLSDTQKANVLSGLSYLNIHSVDLPTGEIRGQIDDVKTPCGPNAFVYDFPIQGCQEVPFVNTQATGRGTVFVNTVTNTLHYVITFSGLSSAETMAHIHGPAVRGAPAGILFTFPMMGSPKVGTWNYPDAQEANILGGLTYVNIHSANFGNGEIRGQIDNVGNCQPPLAAD